MLRIITNCLLSLLLCFAVLIFMSGCGGSKTVTPVPPAVPVVDQGIIEQPAVPNSFPNLPSPSELKGANEWGDAVESVAGGDYEAALPSSGISSIHETSLLFTPDWQSGDNGLAGAAYCIYHLKFGEYTLDFNSLTANWADAPSDWSNVWFGVSAWDSDSWHWDYSRPNGKVGFRQLENHLDADGNLLVVMVVIGDNDLVLDSLDLSGGYIGPHPTFTATPLEGNYPLTVVFDATGTYSLQGEITRYSWDFKDGSENEITNQPTVTHVYRILGSFTPYLSASDGYNGAGITGEQITVVAPGSAVLDEFEPDNSFEYIETIPPFELSGVPAAFTFITRYVSLGIRVAEIRFTRANDSSGEEWPAPVTIATTAEGAPPLTSPSSLIVNNCPALAYVLNDEIWFLKASDPLGSSWDAPMMLFEGRNSLLCLVDSLPTLFYEGVSLQQGTFMVAADDIDGASWSNPATQVHTVGWPVNMEMIAGRPALCLSTPSAEYVIADDAQGTSWATPIEVINADDQFEDVEAKLLNANGFPAIGAYFMPAKSIESKVYYTVATDPDGSAWSELEIVAESTLDGPKYRLEDAYLISGLDSMGLNKVAALIQMHSDGGGSLALSDHIKHDNPGIDGLIDWDNSNLTHTYGIAEDQALIAGSDFLRTGWFVIESSVGDTDLIIFKTMQTFAP